jgi:GT2 family glycosyltransferase
VKAAIIVTTKNRKTELARTLESAIAQSGASDVLVIDDGSTDGTQDFVRAQFPTVRVMHSDLAHGYIVHRNRAATLVDADVIFSIDDDAEFSSPDIVSKIVEEFDDRRIAAVAIPFVNVRIDDTIQQAPPTTDGTWITNEFIGTAYAIRRDIFLQFGGFREILFHQGEEGDFCIRLLDRGFLVRCGNSKPILHYLSPTRSEERVNAFGQRNLMLFAWANVPTIALGPHLIATIVKGLLWGIRHGQFRNRLHGTILGIRDIIKHIRTRKPVRLQTYRVYRRLKKKGPAKIEAVIKQSGIVRSVRDVVVMS